MRVAVVARPRARGAPASARGEGAIACARIVRRARPGRGTEVNLVILIIYHLINGEQIDG